jgi:hypothetical protein
MQRPSGQPQRRSRIRLRRSVTYWLGAAVLGLLVVGPLKPIQGEADVRFHTLRHWVPTVLPSDIATGADLASVTTLIVDPVARDLYAISRHTGSNGAAGWIGLYDADSLNPIGGGVSTDPITTAVPDVSGGRVFAATLSSQGIPGLDVLTPTSQGVTVTSSAPLATLAGLSIVGMYQEETSLYVLASEYDTTLPASLAFVPGTIQVARIDLSSLTKTSVTLSWATALGACQLPVGFTQQQGMDAFAPAAGLGFAPAAHALYFGCAAPDTTAGRPPLPAGVGELALPKDGSAPTSSNFTLFPHPGDFVKGDSFFDRQSHRLILTAGTTRTAFAFDTSTNTYPGSIGLGTSPTLVGAGLNVATGQFYGYSQYDGLVAAFFRLTPVGQAVFDSDYIPPPTGAQPPVNPIAVDPAVGRLFLMQHVNKISAQAYFLVVQYDGGSAALPPPPNPDANTTDMAENPAQTGHTFSGSAEGYGAVVRWVGGIYSTALNAGFDLQNNVPAGPGSREMRFAYLNGVALSLSQASASSVALDRDGANTGHDQAAVCAVPYTQAGLPSPAPAQPAPPTAWNDNVCNWVAQPAQCSNFGGTITDQQQTSSAGTAASTCDVAHQLASAKASENGAPLNGVDITSASVSGSVSEDATNGTLTTVTSIAKGIELLGGAVKIGEVGLTATSQAHGRSDTAKSTFTRTIQNVVIQGTDYCATQCDVNSLASQINSQFSGLMRVDFPTPDPTVTASPGGYQALNRRSLAEQVQEGDLNDQPGDRTEVPAMVVTVFVGDNQQPGRILTYLAGAETEARYGIYPLGQIIDQPIPGVPFDSGLASPGSAGLAELSSGLQGGNGGNGGNSSSNTGGRFAPLAGLLPPGGWRWLSEHPVEALKLLFMWAVLLSPVYVAARRWLLLQRNRVLLEANG